MDSFEQGRFWLERKRPDKALPLLRQAVAEGPDDYLCHMLLAMCLRAAEKGEQALESAVEAVRLAPDEATAHWALSMVLESVGRMRESEQSAREAVCLDPEDADNWTQLASVQLEMNLYTEALESADKSLELEPDAGDALNYRAVALRNLGRRDESTAAMRAALHHEPDDATTHVNAGRGEILLGNRKQAMHHFQEALRIDPTRSDAREGIVEALRSINPVYSWLLRVAHRAHMRFGKWMLIVPVVLVVLLYVNLAASAADPLWHLLSVLGMMLFALFAMLTWSWTFLMDALLLLHPLGRRAYTRRAKVLAISAVTTFLGGAAIGVTGYFLPSPWLFPTFMAGLMLFILTIPLCVYGRSPEGRLRRVLGWSLGLAVALSVLSVVQAFPPAPDGEVIPGMPDMFKPALWVSVGTTWVNLIGRAVSR